MEFKNYWETSDGLQYDFKYTDNIHKIIEEQCKYLFRQTKGKVFSVFAEIKMEDSMLAAAKAMSKKI